jgi:hypothetical protein
LRRVLTEQHGLFNGEYSVADMVLKVSAIEDIPEAGFVSVLFNDTRTLCRNSNPSEPPDAIAARNIVKGEAVIFDTGRNTPDLLRPGRAYYRNF